MSIHKPRRGFSMVEMLVVIGIIVVVLGILMPAMMSARKSARAALCLNNLSQLGQLYYYYATANHDYIPLGTSCEPPAPWTGYQTRNNQYLWVDGAPSAALGPFLANGLITEKTAKLLYCPLEETKELKQDYNLPLISRALNHESVTIQISYAVRPVNALWTHDKANQSVTYPQPMPKLIKQKHFALLAEHPQSQPYAHREEHNARLNVLYADSSVRPIWYFTFRPEYQQYVEKAGNDPPGTTEPSNLACINEVDKAADTIWRVIDEN